MFGVSQSWPLVACFLKDKSSGVVCSHEKIKKHECKISVPNEPKSATTSGLKEVEAVVIYHVEG